MWKKLNLSRHCLTHSCSLSRWAASSVHRPPKYILIHHAQVSASPRHCCLRVVVHFWNVIIIGCIIIFVIAHRILSLFSQPTYRAMRQRTPHAHTQSITQFQLLFFLVFSSRFSSRSLASFDFLIWLIVLIFQHTQHNFDARLPANRPFVTNRRVQKLQSCWILRHEIENWTKLESKELLLFFSSSLKFPMWHCLPLIDSLVAGEYGTQSWAWAYGTKWNMPANAKEH